MKNRRGVSIIEFSLAGIPALFVMISAIEMALGMWQYHTLCYAIKEGTRAAISRGAGCLMTGNSCSTTVGALAAQIADTAIGIPASELNVTFTSASGTVETCAPLASCFASTDAWPPVANGDNLQGRTISTAGSFTLHAALAMFWPGAHSVAFQTATLSASSTQQIMF
jgi:hypothetical protein